MSSCACKPPTSHSLRVVVGDAIKRRDPTQTGDLRRKFRADIGNRIRVLKRLLRSALVTHDIMGFSKVTVNTISALANAPASSQISGVRGAATSSNKLDAFQNWLWTAIGEVFIGRPGTQSWTASYIRAAYDKGWMRAQTLSGQLLAPDHDRLDTLVNMTYSELEGIADAMYQQANRELTNAMLNSVRAPQMYNAIAARLDAIGATRGRAMAATMVVRAYGEATLDGFAAAGLAKVGVVAETKPKGVIKDAMTMLFDASKKRRKVKTAKTKKVKAAAPDEEFPEEVDVLTAGDDLVCPICDDIANSGPYDILDARGLIPAHPNCRCAFIPAFDLRFAGDAEPAKPKERKDGPSRFVETGEGLEVHHVVEDDGPIDEARGPDGRWVPGSGSASVGSHITRHELGETGHILEVGHNDHRKGVNGYSGSRSAFHINEALRKGTRLSRDDEETVFALQKEIAESPVLDHDESFYRGVKENFTKTLKAGDTFTDKGFVSLTSHLGTAEYHAAMEETSFNRAKIMRVVVPKGAHLLTVEASGEREHIIQRGSKFRVNSATKDKVEIELLHRPNIQLDAGPVDEERDDHGRWTSGGNVVAYHGTLESVADKVSKEGLTINKPPNYEADSYQDGVGHSVYVTTSLKNAKQYATFRSMDKNYEVEPVVFELGVPEQDWKEFKQDNQDRSAKFTNKSIPVEWIKARLSFHNGMQTRTVIRDQQLQLAYLVVFVTTGVPIVNDDGPVDEERDDHGRWTTGGSALSKADEEALVNYTSVGKKDGGLNFYDVNKALRNGAKLTDAQEKFVNDLNAALDKLPAVQEMVYRGIDKSVESLYEPGTTVKELAFTSATKEQDTAHGMFGIEGTNFYIKSKSSRLIPQKLSGLEDESEVLFKAGTSFKVTKVKAATTETGHNGKPRIVSGEVHLEEV